MKIHKCYFCNYETYKYTNLKTHVMKQKKCSYLIKSIPINSIDEYYNLRDLHKKEPNNAMWGEDEDNETPPKYYNSDSESEIDDEAKEQIYNNKQYIENKINTYLNPVYPCEYCNKEFNRKDSLKRHYGTCKVLKQLKKDEEEAQIKEEEYRIKKEKEEAKKQQTMKELEDKELRDQILLLKSLMDEQDEKNRMMDEKTRMMDEKNRMMEEEIKLLKENGVGSSNTDNSITTTNSNNTTNNTQNNIQIENQEVKNIKNEITINTFGRENKELFNDENYMLSWIEKPFNAIPHMVEKLHFCPKSRPENTNIRINNISNGKSQIYKNGVWKTIMRYELIYDLVNECAQKLIDTYEMYVDEGKIKRMDRFEKFMRQFEKDDPYFVKSQNEKMDCKLIDLMKKHKTYLNSLE